MLRTSMARGRAWFTTDAELRRFAALCIGERCKADIRDDIRYATEKPVSIELTINSLGIQARIAQYYWLESMDAIKAKLAQFPAGTQFQIRTSGGAPQSERDRIIAEIRRYSPSKALQVN